MKKDVVIRIRMRKEEYESLLRESQEEGLSLSAYARLVLLSKKSKLKFTREEKREYIRQIRKVGVNINQIAKRMNSGFYRLEDQLFLQEDLAELLSCVRKIQREA